MHHANDQAPSKSQIPMLMVVAAVCVRRVVAGMGVDMQVVQALLMFVKMKMCTPLPEPAQNSCAEINDHHTDRKLEHGFDPGRYRFAKEKQYPTYCQQGYRMTEAPDASSQEKSLSRRLTGTQCGDGGEVIGLQCVLHSDNAAKKQ
jgi:hypothetical protein